MCIGKAAVQGAVQTVGSSIVNRYSRVSAAVRVNRSVSCMCWSDPRTLVLSVKLIVSTTSVVPSHRPRESPIHCRTVPCARPSMGMMRASWIISFRSAT